MAKQFGSQVDLQKIPVLNLVMHSAASGSPPTGPVNGQLWYDTTNNKGKLYENGSWVDIFSTAAAGGPAGGDLAGTYPNPTIGLLKVITGYLADGAVTSLKIADGTITDTDVATANKDGIAGTASLRTLGTGAAQAAAGNDSRFTDSRAPNGAAGGDLTGTYPNPQIAAGVIVDADVAAANKDGTAVTPSLRTLGTGAAQAAAGNDARFTDSRPPSGAAGGDLVGSTYPNPVIAALAVTAAKIAAATITDVQVAAANKDGVVGTPSLRTLGAGAQQAMAGNTRLDQVPAPTAPVSMNSQRIISVADPTGATDGANKQYVDSTAAGLDPKGSVRAATTANIALSGTQTIDTVAVVGGDRVLVKNQTTPSQNGIYVAAAGAWARATDMDAWTEVPGAHTFIELGGQADTGWVCSSDQGGTLETTAITWTQFSGAGAFTAGAGLTQTGTTIDVVGTTNRISVAADSIDIAATYVGQASITTVGTIGAGTWQGTAVAVANGGTGATTAAGARTALAVAGKFAGNVAALTAGVEATLVHNLNSTDVGVWFKVVASSADLDLAWRTVDANTIGITADVAYGANAIRATVMG